jgi:hypothetical protein
MREDPSSRGWSYTLSIQDIDEQTALQARHGCKEGADIVDALLDLHEQRLKRHMRQGVLHDHEL